MKCNKHGTAFMNMCLDCKYVFCRQCATDKKLIKTNSQCATCGGYNSRNVTTISSSDKFKRVG